MLAGINSSPSLTKCDAQMYQDIKAKKQSSGKLPEEAKAIQEFINEQGDFYHMNEFEMAILTGLDVHVLRNNRRSNYNNGKEVKPLWPFHKADGKSKVYYILGEVRNMISTS